MNVAAQANPAVSSETEAMRLLALQKLAHRENPIPALESRRRNLKLLEQLLLENQEAICEAISRDFGNRAHQETKLLELFLAVDGIRDSHKRLAKWMKPQKRKGSIWFLGASNSVIPQPKGVVGVVAPWNYPLFLVMGPVTAALAAGNRCLVKMAANSRNLCALLSRLVAEHFDERTLAIVPDVSGSFFSSLPFDHLIFTGSADTGRRVMKAAADNLTPVTLELGGKSPVIVAPDFDLRTAASRILQMKTVNAGQTCVAPDYLFVHEAQLDDFVAHCRSVAPARYPSLAVNDYTAIIDPPSYARLLGYLDDARRKGAQVIPLLPGSLHDEGLRKIAPVLVVNVDDEMQLMQEEIFGPILPIRTYKSLDEVLDYINDRDHPLALYLFSNQRQVQDRIVSMTLSGGVAINDCGLHVAQHDLPFGGVGASGMGHYHGYEGFVEISKLRPVFKQFSHPAFPLLHPPYGKGFERLIRLMLGR
ncbi:coniferyl aldehyde dehydrogenase [Metapseudomonas boanensis]|uniref:Aldehyde dehydrogenase n=1 Tax=Metapseudomonas boanensis TaxID=2822138 RepID=A0ABS5XI13_9GAMM|nr:coniferyl aldehyde dehydrogenase [Pseudomonas boanensis]MBT8766700.1 coniferyl aldehyde dehydrogenase [Pseudomonas boanensis]